jgi:hypothetical protein
MRLRPFHPVRVNHGSRGLPLPRAWHALANGIRAAPPVQRPAGGYRDGSRPQRGPLSGVSALVIATALAPQDACGVALGGCPSVQQSRQDR